MHPIVAHIRTLNLYNRPDYLLIYNCFLKLIAKYKIKYMDKYDWETEEQVLQHQKLHSKPAPYENAKEFFSSDPVGINEAPPPGQSTKSTPSTDDIENMLKRAKGEKS